MAKFLNIVKIYSIMSNSLNFFSKTLDLAVVLQDRRG